MSAIQRKRPMRLKSTSMSREKKQELMDTEAVFDKSEWERDLRPSTAGNTFTLNGKKMQLQDYKSLGILVVQDGEQKMDSEDEGL